MTINKINKKIEQTKIVCRSEAKGGNCIGGTDGSGSQGREAWADVILGSSPHKQGLGVEAGLATALKRRVTRLRAPQLVQATSANLSDVAVLHHLCVHTNSTIV